MFEESKGARTPLVDIQSTRDERNIPIDRVGVRHVLYPITLRERDNGSQQTVGNFTLTVDLPHEFKGTHMSRFLEVLGEHNRDISPDTIPVILARLREKLNSETSHLEVTFTYFREKAAPVTGKVAMMGYECGFSATGGSKEDFVIKVNCPVTTLCPCSKEISAYGAHNQRGYVRVAVRPRGKDVLWLECIIDLIEQAASAPLYPLLKRPDEKFVTEQAYDNPRFVEDMVREVSIAFDNEDRIGSYEIEVENHESIHAHNAYACVKRDKA
ncbi:MAG TPA: GTP cyclohydrolase FolE2 [Fimbriimonadaceae bacterium]|nr:GTP cyclohydrolase FolE2 [Fimbriimonadaceae bacterium]